MGKKLLAKKSYGYSIKDCTIIGALFSYILDVHDINSEQFCFFFFTVSQAKSYFHASLVPVIFSDQRDEVSYLLFAIFSITSQHLEQIQFLFNIWIAFEFDSIWRFRENYFLFIFLFS